MATLQEIIVRAGITMKAERTDTNPNMDDNANMDHWRCTFRLRSQRGSWTIPFSMGFGHNGKAPKAAEVLDMSDASGADLSFEEWCHECDCDTDSRKAEHKWRAIREQTTRARRFFGDSLFSELLGADRL